MPTVKKAPQPFTPELLALLKHGCCSSIICTSTRENTHRSIFYRGGFPAGRSVSRELFQTCKPVSVYQLCSDVFSLRNIRSVSRHREMGWSDLIPSVFIMFLGDWFLVFCPLWFCKTKNYGPLPFLSEVLLPESFT